MNDFLKMDIFFFVTTIAVALVTLLVILILIRVFRILGHVEEISKIVSEEGNLVRGDIAELRASIKKEGFKFATAMSSFGTMVQRIFIKRRNTKKHENKE